MHIDRRAVLARLLTGGLAAWAGNALAQPAYPSRAVTMVVPWPPGGPSDFYARIYQEPFQKRFGQPLIVDNVAGVSGALGARRVLDAAPDGHTLGLIGAAELILAPLGLSAVKHRPEDFRIAAIMGGTALVLLARADLPLATLEQVADGARQAPLTCAHTGNGSLYHLAGAKLAQVSGLRLTGVPYKGAGPILTDLGGGHVDLALLPLAGPVVGMLRQGRLKAIAHTGAEPQAQLPDLPSFTSDPRLREMAFDIWLSLAVRRDTPDDLAQRLNRTAYEVVAEAAVQKATAETGGRVGTPRTLAELERLYGAEIARYRGIAQSIGLQPQ